ncbi:hypothetical protein BJX64DRAFT_292722 [Aspergillus heterothallicus]
MATRGITDGEEVTSIPHVTTSLSMRASSSESMDTLSNSIPVDAPTRSSRSKTAMIGGIVGGVATLLIILGVIAYLLYHAKKKRKRFTLLHWRPGPRTEDATQALEAGNIASIIQIESQPSGTAIKTITLSTKCDQSKTALQDPSPTESLKLSARIDSPEKLPPTTFPADTRAGKNSSSASIPTSTAGPSSKGANYPALSILRCPSGVHPAFRQRSATTPTPDSATSLMNSFSGPCQIPHETTSELFDTGFYRGRAELSSNPSRELINIPYDDRLRERKRISLWRSSGPRSPVVTRDGAILTANFNQVPVEPGCHAVSFTKLDSPSDASPPAYRLSWSRSREGAGKEEKNREGIERIRQDSSGNSVRPGIQFPYRECERIEENKEGEEMEEKWEASR